MLVPGANLYTKCHQNLLNNLSENKQQTYTHIHSLMHSQTFINIYSFMISPQNNLGFNKIIIKKSKQRFNTYIYVSMSLLLNISFTKKNGD